MKRRMLAKSIAGLLLVAMISPLFGNIIASAAAPSAETPSAEKDFYYLSDIPYIKEKSYAGWKNLIQLNESPSGGKIQLLVNGEALEFDSGIGAHAESCIVYDIEPYSNVQSRFFTYLGVDARMTGGNGVIFKISVSDDGETWEERFCSKPLKGSDEAVRVDLDVSGKKYLKLFADANGSNGQDHAVYANTRLLKPDYNPAIEDNVPFFMLDEYDRQLSANTIDKNLQDNIQLIYERELIRRVGYGAMRKVYNDPQYKEGLEFLRTNERALAYFIEGGPLNRQRGTNPYNTLVAFCQIYNKHKADMVDPSEDYFRLRLAISIACAHNYPENARFWMTPNKELDAVKRYETYIDLSKPNGIMDDAGTGDNYVKWSGKEFRELRVPMMRWVVDARMNDDEFYWLADYALKERAKGNEFLNAYNYIEYKNTFKYDDPRYYSKENHAMWNEKYNFDSFYTDYGQNIKRLWIVFEEGAVCGGLAKTYANLAEVFGRPSIVVGQPGHAATVTWMYSKSAGKYTWVLQNDVSGWAQSNSEYNDFMLGWGISPYATDKRAAYTMMATDAVEDYDNYVKANQCVLLANSYEEASKKEALYKKALEYQKFNLNAWEGLTTLRLADSTLTSKDYFDFAKQIMDTLAYYPKPMNDLLMALKPHIDDQLDAPEFELMRVEVLKKAAQATPEECRQPEVCKVLAQYLLNQSTPLATFSFDGEKAGKIVLSDQYSQSDVRVRYSLDGGKHWDTTSDHEIQLSAEQLASLTPENDIKVGFVGVTLVHTIDLNQSKNPKNNNVIPNDYENLFVGNTENLESSIDGGNTWQSYTAGLDSDTRFEGEKSVLLRYKDFGQSIHSETDSFAFTPNNDTPEATYLPLKHVNLVSYSSQQNNGAEAARNLIDGNINTRWHSAYNQVDKKEYVVGFDTPRFISKLEYFPHGPNGRWHNVEIYTTTDPKVNAETRWKLVASVSLENTEDMKTILLNCDEPAKYLRVRGLDSWAIDAKNQGRYFSGRMLNFYEDVTRDKLPLATVSYSTTDKTNQDVVASITLPEGCQMMEGEPRHTFTENGDYTFRYQDTSKNLYEVTASVDWIRKAALTGTVTYSETQPTHNSITATIGDFGYDDVYVVNNNQSPVYTFNQNGEFVFELADSYGNTGTVTASTNNIAENIPKVHIEYSTTEWTAEPVTATLISDAEDTPYTIVNNEGSNVHTFDKNGSFAFELKDANGEKFKILAMVDSIDSTKDQVQAQFSTQEPTPDPVQVTVDTNPDTHAIINGNGTNAYTFQQNGTYVFKIRLQDTGRVVDFPVTVSNISSTPDPIVPPAPDPIDPPAPNPDPVNPPAPQPEVPSTPNHLPDPDYPLEQKPQATPVPYSTVRPAPEPDLDSSADPDSDKDAASSQHADKPSASSVPNAASGNESASREPEILETQTNGSSAKSMVVPIVVVAAIAGIGVFAVLWLRRRR